MIILMSRQVSQCLTPQFYAEDGARFFYDAASGPASLFFAPYNGYYQFVPRATAALFTPLPWSIAPAAFVFTAFGLAAWTATRFISSSLPAIIAWGGGISVLFIPGQGEALGNICCLQFIICALIPLAFIQSPPQSALLRIVTCVEVVVCCLTGPFCIIFIPVVVLLCWRQKKDRWLIASFAVATALQLGVVLCNPRPTFGFFPAVLQALEVAPYYLRDLFTAFLHARPQAGGLMTGLICGALLGALIAWPGQKNRLPVLALWGGAAGLLLASRVANTGWANAFGNGARYTYLPFILVLWSIFWLAHGTRSRPAWFLAFSLVMLVVVNTASCWQGRVFPNLEWAQQVREAQQGTRTHFDIPATPIWSFSVPNQKDTQSPAVDTP